MWKREKQKHDFYQQCTKEGSFRTYIHGSTARHNMAQHGAARHIYQATYIITDYLEKTVSHERLEYIYVKLMHDVPTFDFFKT